LSTFQQQLETYLDGLKDRSRRGASEDSIRDAFLTFLRGAFPRLSLADPFQLEKHIPALRVRGGFADALYGDLIFEFKKVLDDSSRADGTEKLTRYLKNQQHPDRFLGLLTDGRSLEVYALRTDDLAKVDGFLLDVDRAEYAKLWLDCYLFHEKNVTPTANDVALRFGERSPTYWRSTRILEALWSTAFDRSSTRTKFIEWQSLLSIVYGSSVGDEELYLRHTYLALFARLLAFVAVKRRAPSNGELRGILNGQAFEKMGFENFVGDDFFTWMTDSASWQETRPLLHAMGTRLASGYNLAEIHEDLLKELYQELVDPQTRHDLGEYYTPDWLAEVTLREAGFPGKDAEAGPPSLCDPACGSGTFLFTAVRLLRESGMTGKNLVAHCADHLAGMDVHPLAVTIAKTNLLLALGHDLRRYKRRFAVPVFMADSLNVVDHSESTTGSEIEIPVDVERIETEAKKHRPKHVRSAFGIPTSLADRPDVLHKALEALQELGRPELDDSTARTGWRARADDLGIPAAQEHLWLANLDLMRWLLSPPPTNSVWRFILQNACQPQLLARRRFAFVVGNPPWLSYRYIQRRDYQQRIRRLVGEYGLLKSKQTHLFTQMELATLFFAFCADWYLAEGGTLAFVMPRSVLTGAKQHEEFRKRYLESCDLLIDCERVDPLFNVPACALVWKRTGPRADQGGKIRGHRTIPKLMLAGSLTSRNTSWSNAQRHLTITKDSHTALLVGDPSPYFRQMTQGASIVPRCLWFVRPPEAARIIAAERPQLETDASIERRAKKPWKGVQLQGPVEADFLFATLLSDHMVPFGWRRPSLVVLPLSQRADGSQCLLEHDDAVRAGKIGLANWLREATSTWNRRGKKSERVGSVYERLDFSGCLTRQRTTGVVKLLYNTSGTHLCACVVDARKPNRIAEAEYDLRVQGFVADTTTYWFETPRAEEAHFLCAVLNAPHVDHAIKPHQPKGLFGATKGGGQRHIHRRPFEVLPIPQYSPGDPRHRHLADLSRRCHKAVSDSLSGADEGVLKTPIGRLRTRVRTEVLPEDLDQINAVVQEILVH